VGFTSPPPKVLFCAITMNKFEIWQEELEEKKELEEKLRREKRKRKIAAHGYRKRHICYLLKLQDIVTCWN
jgi:hypothetical protein